MASIIVKWLVGDVVSDAYQKGSTLIKQAEKTGDRFTVKCADEIIRVIDNFSVQYQDSMEKTVEKIDQTAQKTLISLYDLISEVEKKTVKRGDEFANRIQSIANTIPCADKTPQITQVLGTVIAPSQKRDLFLIIKGNFPNIGERKPEFLTKKNLPDIGERKPEFLTKENLPDIEEHKPEFLTKENLPDIEEHKPQSKLGTATRPISPQQSVNPTQNLGRLAAGYAVFTVGAAVGGYGLGRPLVAGAATVFQKEPFPFDKKTVVFLASIGGLGCLLSRYGWSLIESTGQESQSGTGRLQSPGAAATKKVAVQETEAAVADFAGPLQAGTAALSYNGVQQPHWPQSHVIDRIVAKELAVQETEAAVADFVGPLQTVTATTNSITFSTDRRNLTPPAEDRIVYTQGILKFPRAKGYLPGSASEDIFHILIASLPLRPGKISLETVTQSIGQDSSNSERQTLTKTIELRSSAKLNLGDQTEEIVITAPQGWKLDQNSIKLRTPVEARKKYTIPKGSYNSNLIAKSDQEVRYCVWTKELGHRKSGWAKFVLYCDATRPTPQLNPSSTSREEIKLSWGDSVIRKVPQNFRVIFDSFDGNHSEFANTDLTNPYIEVRNLGCQVEIKAKNPEDIDL